MRGCALIVGLDWANAISAASGVGALLLAGWLAFRQLRDEGRQRELERRQEAQAEAVQRLVEIEQKRAQREDEAERRELERATAEAEAALTAELGVIPRR